MEAVLMKDFEISGVVYQLLNDKSHLIVRRALENEPSDPFRWAVKTAGGWKVYVGNEYQMCIGGVYERLTPEDVARKMLSADNHNAKRSLRFL